MKNINQLTINNFCAINEAVISINYFTVLIGPQAQGKSLIAKLTYFFLSIKGDFTDYLFSGENYNKLNNVLEKRFLSYFPEYIIEQHEDFFIEFTYSDLYSISVIKKSDKKQIKFQLSVPMRNKLSHIKKKLRQENKMLTSLVIEKGSKSKFMQQILTSIFDAEKYVRDELGLSGRVLFIPAGRSFYAFLQDNIFNFLKSLKDANIDPLMLDFASKYESIKKGAFFNFDEDNPDNTTFDWISDKSKVNHINSLINSVLQGQYEHSKEEDWIHSRGKRTKLINSSSGQQESLPILLSLLASAQFDEIIFEEPEAHLFPEAQKLIVDLLGFFHNYNKGKTRFFITTHSPYVLSAFNNLILGSEAYEKTLKSKDTVSNIKKLNKIIENDRTVGYDNFHAYQVLDGGISSLMNEETRLINCNIIDKASNTILNEFDKISDFIPFEVASDSKIVK